MMFARWFSLLPILLRAGEEIDPEAGEFNVFLFCLLLVALTAFCLLVVMGIVVGLLVAAAMAGAGFLGIMANAILSGLASRSPKVGVTVLILQFGGLIGFIVGTASCVIVRWMLGTDPVDLVALLICGTFGILLGGGMAWISFNLIVIACSRTKAYCDSRLRQSRTSAAAPLPEKGPGDRIVND